MGKLNEIQEQVTQSFGNNSFTTKITDTTVEFDSAKDKFTFKDPVEVPSINVGGTESVPFSAEDKTKLDNLQTPMQIKGRVDSVGDLPTEDVSVGDTYLVGLSGSETFDEYVCTGFAGSPEAPVWESVGSTQVQADWDQNDNTKADYIKNRICYDTTVVYADVENPNAEEHEPTSSIYFEAPIPTVGDAVNVQYKYWTGGMNPHWEEVNQNVTVGPYMNPGEAVVLTSGDGAVTIFYKESWADESHPEATGKTSTQTVFDKVEVTNRTIKKIDDKYLTQSDWNQNDNTKADYIKNRICYEEENILITANITINSSTSYSFEGVSDVVPEPTEGGKLYLKFSSGTTEVFETTWQHGDSYGFSFNLQAFGGGGGDWNVDYQNKIHFTGGGGGATIPFVEGDTFTIFEKKIVPIDDKFIPQLGGVQFKIDGSPASLQASIDGGSTWQTVTLS